MRYTVIIPRTVQKQLAKLHPEITKRVETALVHLEENARPSGSKKLRGRSAWRIRVGDYRIIYEIEDEVLRIIIVEIGHRRDVYRDS